MAPIEKNQVYRHPNAFSIKVKTSLVFVSNLSYPAIMSDLSSQPAIAPPPGVTPSFIDPPSQGYLIVVTVSVCLLCSTLLVLPRIYVSIFTSRTFKWDDCTS